MKALLCIASLFLLVHQSFAQASAPTTNITAAYNLDRMSDFRGLNPSELVMGIPMAPGKTVGDTYLSEDWKTGTIILYENDKMIERYPIRYDIQTNELEIKASNGIKALQGQRIKSFTWVDSPDSPPAYFINAKDLKCDDGSVLTGFLQVLEDGSIPLFKRTYLQIRKADYNVSLNVGSVDDKILKKDEFYLLYDEKIYETPSSKKKLLPFFGDHAAAMEEFMKDKNLGVSKEGDLQWIFNHYNSLAQKK